MKNIVSLNETWIISYIVKKKNFNIKVQSGTIIIPTEISLIILNFPT
jgi:hypothetical protein